MLARPPPAIEDLLHPLGAAGPIAVEYVHLLALEDEGAETVLRDTHTQRQFAATRWFEKAHQFR